MSETADPRVETHWDVIIVGAGLGGSALAWSLRDSGLKILILERGSYVPQEAENWDPDAVVTAGRYEPPEMWLDGDDAPFRPRVYYNVGGSSKFFGGSAFRLRREDFARKCFADGTAPAWPISYDDLAPWYDLAEERMWVHGLRGADLTDPATTGDTAAPPYPHPLKQTGLHPFALPIAVHQGHGGHCRKGSPCDGFPCKIRAKGDGENAFLRPALREGAATITLLTEAQVLRLEHDREGLRIAAVHYHHQGRDQVARLASVASADPASANVGGIVALAAGAANSASLLLRSATPSHPQGLANGSGQIGRNFMAHNNTVLMAVHPFRLNRTQFQKTLAINDWYNLGNIQMRGKVLPQNLARSPRALVRLCRHWIARRSFDFWLMSEDRPDPENRVEPLEMVGDGTQPQATIRLTRRLNNMDTHRQLVRRFRRVLRQCGFWFVLERQPEPRTIQHQVGTIRFGTDPRTAVLDRNCRSFEVGNLYVVDGSVFPTSAAVNPALTIAANALRVGAYLREKLQQPDGIDSGS